MSAFDFDAASWEKRFRGGRIWWEWLIMTLGVAAALAFAALVAYFLFLSFTSGPIDH